MCGCASRDAYGCAERDVGVWLCDCVTHPGAVRDDGVRLHDLWRVYVRVVGR